MISCIHRSHRDVDDVDDVNRIVHRCKRCWHDIVYTSFTSRCQRYRNYIVYWTWLPMVCLSHSSYGMPWLAPLWKFYSESGATFVKASWAGICQETFEIVPYDFLWSIWGSHQTLWSPLLPNFTWHSGTRWHPALIRHFTKSWHCYRTWPLFPFLTLLPYSGMFP